MSDPYLPMEQDLKLTRQCLAVIMKHRFGATVLTKSDLILRDMDLLYQINDASKCVVQMTLTASNDCSSRRLEPGVCTSSKRYEALCKFRDAGIPTVVWLSPILPFLTDTEENIRQILEYCASARVRGVICFGMGMTLREGNREYFYRQLDRQFPGLRFRYEKQFGTSYEVFSPNREKLMTLFSEFCEKYRIMHHNDQIFSYLRQYEQKETQLSLF